MSDKQLEDLSKIYTVLAEELQLSGEGLKMWIPAEGLDEKPMVFIFASEYKYATIEQLEKFENELVEVFNNKIKDKITEFSGICLGG